VTGKTKEESPSVELADEIPLTNEPKNEKNNNQNIAVPILLVICIVGILIILMKSRKKIKDYILIDTILNFQSSNLVILLFLLSLSTVAYAEISENFSVSLSIYDDFPPRFSLNSTNSVTAGIPISHRLFWEDNVALSGYVFSFYNGSNTTYCSGSIDCSVYETQETCINCSQCKWNEEEHCDVIDNGSCENCELGECDTNCSLAGCLLDNTEFVNDSWVAFTADMCPNPYTECWSNVTKTINSTVGATIKWCVYANDTSNNWNKTSCSDPFSYETTGEAGVNCHITSNTTWSTDTECTSLNVTNGAVLTLSSMNLKENDRIAIDVSSGSKIIIDIASNISIG